MLPGFALISQFNVAPLNDKLFPAVIEAWAPSSLRAAADVVAPVPPFEIGSVEDIWSVPSSFIVWTTPFVVVFNFTKKYLLNLSSNKVSYLIICVTLALLLSEAILANLQFNYPINYVKLFSIIATTVILYFPSLLIFSKIDKL